MHPNGRWIIRHSQNPDQALVELGVHSLQVRKLDGFPQELLVKGQREASVYVVPMKHSKAHDPPHKVEIW